MYNGNLPITPEEFESSIDAELEALELIESEILSMKINLEAFDQIVPLPKHYYSFTPPSGSASPSTRISIRISSDVLESVKREALGLGIPYQTWINRILATAVVGL